MRNMRELVSSNFFVFAFDNGVAITRDNVSWVNKGKEMMANCSLQGVSNGGEVLTSWLCRNLCERNLVLPRRMLSVKQEVRGSVSG